MSLPRIIQGGMGAGLSNWRLAQAVASTGQLGVVSGTALDHIFARRLQDGDPGGHMRRALDHFPFPKMAERIWEAYYIPGGRAAGVPYLALPMNTKTGPHPQRELCIVSNFAEVFLAREGHENPVGINYLEKIQTPLVASTYGAMLAGVNYVLMGAGIPLKYPGVLDQLANHETATYNLYIAGAQEGDDNTMVFTPREFIECELPPLSRPKFLAIIASNTLAITMVKKANGKVDGFIIEGPTAGGHNAPPRGKLQLNEAGEPLYGERDIVDLEKLATLGLPFWLAGGYGSPEKLREALGAGATGVQVGTPFALCAESALRDDYRQAVLADVAAGRVSVYTDRLASPTGFPFKVAQVKGSISEAEVVEARPRLCDLGYLREAYRTPDGGTAYRCASEPVKTYVAKGGEEEQTVGRKCICNALLSAIGQPQVRNGVDLEAGVLTAGDDIVGVIRFLPAEGTVYHAADVVAKLLNG
jgi:nitronate monooxygenase